MIRYTKSELTEKKYTVQDAVNSARTRLKGKPYCTNPVQRRERDEKITLAELNDIADSIVLETLMNDGSCW